MSLFYDSHSPTLLISHSLTLPHHKCPLFYDSPTTLSPLQAAILLALNSSIQELKKAAPAAGLDQNDLTLNNGLFSHFHKRVRTQLEPMWHTLSKRTKQLVTVSAQID